MAVFGLDHLIYAAPDLERAVEAIEARTGVRPALGGSHPGRGTRNALLALGPDSYIEILAPDPAQPVESLARASSRIPESPQLTTWVAKCDDLDATVEHAWRRGLDLGAVAAVSRVRPQAEELRWRLTRGDLPGDGLTPFLIDWGDADHPARSAPAGCTLLSLRAEHPDPDRIRGYLAALDLDEGVLTVTRGPSPRLVATLATPRGEVELM